MVENKTADKGLKIAEEVAMDKYESIKEMIQKEIQSISALKERVAFKDMMEGVFLALYEKNEEMYHALEKRVMDDLAYDINRYRICTGLVEKEYLDVSHHLLTAVCEEDIRASKPSIAELCGEITEGGNARLATVFLKGDPTEIQKLLKKDSLYPGIIKTDKEYSIFVKMEPSIRYLQKLEQLYHLFMKNGIPWQTINAPYLFKMVDLVAEKIPNELLDSTQEFELKVDFGEYTSMVLYDMIPLWNVWHLTLESTGFPIPCENHENFEHVISVQEYGSDHAYLVGEKAGIWSVRQNGDRLFVTGQISSTEKWEVYMIRGGEDRRIDRYTYPVMENLRKDGFAERFNRKNGQKVKTKGELERFIRGFELEGYIEYQDCRLEDEGGEPEETYSMNFFMKDEIRAQKGRRRLLLFFKAKGKETWMLRDIASFIVSEVQELYPEYQCEGRIL